MKIGSKEHYEILENFEKNFKYLRLDKEKNKELWSKGYVYENGDANTIYKAFLSGYSLARVNYLNN